MQSMTFKSQLFEEKIKIISRECVKLWVYHLCIFE